MGNKLERREKEREGKVSIRLGDETSDLPGCTRGSTDSRAYPSRWLAKASRKHTGLVADARINAQIICRGYAPPPVVIDIWLSGTAIHQARKSALYPWLARSYTSHPIPVKSGYTAALLPFLSQSLVLSRLTELLAVSSRPLPQPRKAEDD